MLSIEGSWRHYFKDSDAFLMLVAYKDKYGRLGKIAAVAGRKNGKNAFAGHLGDELPGFWPSHKR